MSITRDVGALRAWLRAQGYREQTADLTCRAARQVATWAAEGRTLPRRLAPEARRVLDYLDTPEADAPALEALRGHLEALAAPVALDPRQRRLAARKRRQREARSLGDAEWQRLLAAIEADPSPAAAVLGVLAATGLRVGDALGISLVAWRRAQDTGRLVLSVKGGEERTLLLDGAPDAWGRLGAAWADAGGAASVARLVAPSGGGRIDASGGAYRAVARKLAALAAEAGVSGRVHLHRLRRTVGVQALRVTEDTVAVQQLLGHRSHQTTLGYLDEARPDRVASLQQQIRSRFTTTTTTEET